MTPRPGGMPEAATFFIIADDFTGACDTGVQLARQDEPSAVLIFDQSESPSLDALQTLLSEHRVVVCDTESRHLAPADAAVRVRSCAGAADPARPGVVYKKIDSTLRGNIGAELDALRQVFPGRRLLVAPAFPAAGRTTVDGRCIVHGVPLDRTEFAHDSLAPVHSARIADCLPPGLRVELCDARGLGDVLNRASGGSALIVDAAHDDDLDLIARAVSERPGDFVLVGSAGLAAALDRVPRRDRPAASRRTLAQSTARLPVLGLMGSLSERSRAQAALLVEQTDVHTEYLSAEDFDRDVERAVAALSAGRSVLVATPSRRMRDATRMAGLLGRFARETFGRSVRPALFITGGDTARAVVQELGGECLLARGQIAPGVPLLTMHLGERGDVFVVTKAGGFGDDDIMVRAFDCLREGTCLS